MGVAMEARSGTNLPIGRQMLSLPSYSHPTEITHSKFECCHGCETDPLN